MSEEKTFHGKALRSRKVGGFRVQELVYAPSYDAGLHEHDRAHLALSLSGAYREWGAGPELLCDTSTTIFRPSGTVHFARNMNRPNRVLTIEMEGETVTPPSLRLHEPHTVVGGNLLITMRRLRAELARDDPFSGIGVYGLVLESLAILGRERTSPECPKWRKVIDEVIRDSTHVPSVKALANLVGLSETTFHRQFRRNFNTSVGQYIRARRFEKALFLIEETDTPLARVAVETGFVDQSHFTNAFKMEFGITPNQHRKARLGL